VIFPDVLDSRNQTFPGPNRATKEGAELKSRADLAALEQAQGQTYARQHGKFTALLKQLGNSLQRKRLPPESSSTKPKSNSKRS